MIMSLNRKQVAKGLLSKKASALYLSHESWSKAGTSLYLLYVADIGHAHQDKCKYYKRQYYIKQVHTVTTYRVHTT